MEDVTNWRKASYSGTNGGNCVEGTSTGREVLVRDSKDQDGPRVTVTPDTWRSFVWRIKRGR